MEWDLQELRCFTALARERSFTRAAQACAITQPAFSRRIQQLEARLGLTLVDRRQRPVRITSAGQRLLRACTAIFQQLRLAEKDVQARRRAARETVRIACAVSLQIQVFAPRMAGFNAGHPGVVLDIISIFRRRPADFLERGEAELIFSLRDPRPQGAWGEVFFTSPLELVAPPGHPLLRHPPVHPEQLDGQPFIALKAAFSEAAADWFQARGITQNVALEVESLETAVGLVAGAQGLALLPRYVALPAQRKGDLVVVPVAAALPEVPVYVGAREPPAAGSRLWRVIEFFRPEEAPAA